MDERVAEVMAALRDPFPAEAVGFKPQTVAKSGERCMVVAYIDARDVQDRLNAVLGILGWQDSYDILPAGGVLCRLSVRIDGGEWVTREDVGSPSEQPDPGDRLKAATSDALKRAAVKLGIGRYLYDLPTQWVPYDPQKKQPAELPRLPAWALPGGAGKPRGAAAPPPKPAPAKEPPPADGAELRERLERYEGTLVRDGRCAPGELLIHVSRSGDEAGFGPEIAEWQGPALDAAREFVREFVAARKQGVPA